MEFKETARGTLKTKRKPKTDGIELLDRDGNVKMVLPPRDVKELRQERTGTVNGHRLNAKADTCLIYYL